MKRALCILAVLLVFIASGCSGVILSAEYSELLDQTAALSAETARRAEAGQLTEQQMARALRDEADIWQQFRNARDGKADQ
jgi:hypothetical protein